MVVVVVVVEVESWYCNAAITLAWSSSCAVSVCKVASRAVLLSSADANVEADCRVTSLMRPALLLLQLLAIPSAAIARTSPSTAMDATAHTTRRKDWMECRDIVNSSAADDDSLSRLPAARMVPLVPTLLVLVRVLFATAVPPVDVPPRCLTVSMALPSISWYAA